MQKNQNSRKNLHKYLRIGGAALSIAFLVFLGWLCLVRDLSSKQYRENPEQLTDYTTLALTSGDEAEQKIVPATRGIYSLYLFAVTDPKEDNAVLRLTLKDPDGKVLDTAEKPVVEMASADWNFFTLEETFTAGQNYSITYSLEPSTASADGGNTDQASPAENKEEETEADGTETAGEEGTSKVYLLLCSPEQEAIYSPDAVYLPVLLNGTEQNGAVIQNLEMCYPYSRVTQAAFFAIGVLAVVGIWVVCLKFAAREQTAGKGQVVLNRLRRLEDGIHFFLSRHVFQLCVLAALAVSVYLRYCFTAFQSDDYVSYLFKWYRHFQQYGFVNGLATMAHDYYVPYNLFLALIAKLNLQPRISIMILSCVCDYLCALYLGKITFLLLTEREKAVNAQTSAALSVDARENEVAEGDAGRGSDRILRLSWGVGLVWLFLPPVWLDSAMWKQCDTVYMVFCLISLYRLLKRQYTSSFIFLTTGFVIKLQAAFLLPLYVILYLARRDFRITKFLYLPIGYFLAGLPAILCGADPALIYTTYSNQTTGMQTYMHSFLPNVYMFMDSDDYELFGTAAVLMTLALFILAAAYCCAHRENLTGENVVLLAAWCVWTCPMFLPSMTPRYDLAAYALVMLAALALDRRLLPVAAVFTGITTVCFLCYLLYAYKEVNFQVMAFFYCGSYLAYSLYTWYRIGKKPVRNA